MLRGLGRTVRYARSWSGGSDVDLRETAIERDGKPVPASFITPASRRAALPGWIVLGGVTRMGRFHPQLVRFANALASSGAGVLVPEVPEWRDLRLDPGATAATVAASVRTLRARADVKPGKLGLVGLSFGAAQAAIASTREELRDAIGGVVLFGGHCDLERTLRCQLTGRHEWEGVTHALDPDPYGRWVLASNYLTRVEGCEDAGDVAEALRTLALASTERRVPAWDPSHDDLKVRLRQALPAARRELFDLFAPLTTASGPPSEEGEAMALALAAACREADPLLDPNPHLERVRVPIHLVHGRGDRLIPYTESLRFRQRLPPGVDARVTITGLFAHSANQAPPSLSARMREGAILFRAVQGVLNTV